MYSDSVFGGGTPFSGSIFDRNEEKEGGSIFSKSGSTGSIYESDSNIQSTSINSPFSFGNSGEESMIPSAIMERKDEMFEHDSRFAGANDLDATNDLTNLNYRAENYGGNSIVDQMRGIQARRLNNNGETASLAEAYMDSTLDTRFAGGRYNVTLSDIYSDRGKFEAHMGLKTGMIEKNEENTDIYGDDVFDDRIKETYMGAENVTDKKYERGTFLIKNEKEGGENLGLVDQLTEKYKKDEKEIKNLGAFGSDADDYDSEKEFGESSLYDDNLNNIDESSTIFDKIHKSETHKDMESSLEEVVEGSQIKKRKIFGSISELQEENLREEHNQNIANINEDDGLSESEKQLLLFAVVQDFRKMDLETKLKLIKDNKYDKRLPPAEIQKVLKEKKDFDFNENKRLKKEAEKKKKADEKEERKIKSQKDYENMLREKRVSEQKNESKEKKQNKRGNLSGSTVKRKTKDGQIGKGEEKSLVTYDDEESCTLSCDNNVSDRRIFVDEEEDEQELVQGLRSAMSNTIFMIDEEEDELREGEIKSGTGMSKRINQVELEVEEKENLEDINSSDGKEIQKNDIEEETEYEDLIETEIREEEKDKIDSEEVFALGAVIKLNEIRKENKIELDEDLISSTPESEAEDNSLGNHFKNKIYKDEEDEEESRITVNSILDKIKL